MKELKFKIEGMMCEGCRIRNLLLICRYWCTSGWTGLSMEFFKFGK